MAETNDPTEGKESNNIDHQGNGEKAEEKLETDDGGVSEEIIIISEKVETEGGSRLLYDNEKATIISQKPESNDGAELDETDDILSTQEKNADEIRTPVPVQEQQHLERSRESAPPQVIREHPSLYGLPDNWIIEKRPRTSPNYLGRSDKCFYEPGTLKLFRSLVSVKRHLQATGQLTQEPGQEVIEHTEANHHLGVGDQSLGPQMHSKKKPRREMKHAPCFGF